MPHNLDTIYRKMKLNSQVLPGEWPLVIKDLMYRLEKLEGTADEETTPPTTNTRVEKASSAGRRVSKVSKKKVSPS